MEKLPKPFQSLPQVALPVTQQDWTDLLPSLIAHFDPIHTELSTFFPTPQMQKIRLQSSSATMDLTSVGLHLQEHSYPAHHTNTVTQQGMAGGSSLCFLRSLSHGQLQQRCLPHILAVC